MRRTFLSLLATVLLFGSLFAFLVTPAHAQYPTDGGGSIPSACYQWPVLSYGSSGNYVEFLQTYLNMDYQYGWFSNSPYNFHPLLATDGDFGNNTRNAVMDIQTRYHVQVDGVVGPVTWNLVNPGCGVG